MALISKAIGKSSQASRQPISSLWKSYRSLSTNRSFLRISEEVQEALNSKKPVVALETTIYTHGNTSLQVVKLSANECLQVSLILIT